MREDPEFAAFYAAKGIEIEPEPVLSDDCWLYWEGFGELSGDRPEGLSGPGRIPYISISQYCRDLGLDRAGLLLFVKLIRRMDDAFVSFHRKKEEVPTNG